MDENLAFPRLGSEVEKSIWAKRVKERLKELRVLTSREARLQMFDSKAKQDEQRQRFKKGLVKGIAAKVMRQSTGVHSIDNVWLKDKGADMRLSTDPQEIRKETESFFYKWMESRAEAWGSREQLKDMQFPKLHEHLGKKQHMPHIQWVGEKIESILKRPIQPRSDTEGPGLAEKDRRLRERHQMLERPIELEELERFLGKVKKGTAPGITGVSIEFWAAAPRELKEEMVGFMNACYDNCEVPEIWRRRLVRALAKTEDAVGLEGIRPIALLEVGQKIMTGKIGRASCLCGIFSAKLLDGHVEVNDFGIFSAKLLGGDVEGEAEHEILPFFPLRFLLGRAR